MTINSGNEYPLNKKDYASRFLETLRYLHSTYTKFPKFMIEIMAENFGVPSSEIKELISRFKRNGTLILIKNEGYCYQLNMNL